MAIDIIPVRTRAEKKQFINFEWQVNQNLDNWVSPLKMERKKLLNTRKNPFFKHARIELFLAFKDRKLSGRIAAITNENYNRFHNDKSGFWGFFECIDDQDVADGLFTAAAEWLKAKGRDEMLGPMNPSTNDEAGLLVEGFDTPPYILMPHNHPYYASLVENFGNRKAKDLYAWFITTKEADNNTTVKVKRVAEKIMQRYKISIRHLQIKNLKEEVRLIKEIYNNAWSDNWGFVPFTDEEIDVLANDLKMIADERMLFIAEREGRPIGFSITLPNINEVLQKIPDGRLFPTGLFRLLFGLKKIRSVRVIILGVIKEFQFSGLGAAFYLRTIEKAKQIGYRGGEMSWILEDNHTMNRAIASFGSSLYKTYRIYTYPLQK